MTAGAIQSLELMTIGYGPSQSSLPSWVVGTREKH